MDEYGFVLQCGELWIKLTCEGEDNQHLDKRCCVKRINESLQKYQGLQKSHRQVGHLPGDNPLELCRIWKPWGRWIPKADASKLPEAKLFLRLLWIMDVLLSALTLFIYVNMHWLTLPRALGWSLLSTCPLIGEQNWEGRRGPGSLSGLNKVVSNWKFRIVAGTSSDGMCLVSYNK